MDELCRHIISDRSVLRQLLPAGAVFVGQDTSHEFSVVVEGALGVALQAGHDSLLIFQILEPGACVPALDGQDLSAAPFTLVALTRCLVARVPIESFERIVREKPFLAPMVGAKMASQHVDVLRRLADLRTPSPSRRTASTLLYLAERISIRCSIADGRRIILPQRVIAQVADLSRQRINRALQQLQEMGLIRLERAAVCVLDRPGLEDLARGRSVAPKWAPAESCRLLHPEGPLTCYSISRAPS